MKEKQPLDIIIPVHMDIFWPSKETLIQYILEQNQQYGFTKFALASPDGGWRSQGYPHEDFFRERAEMFLSIKRTLEPYGIICGWWNMLTVKSGLSDSFSPMVKADGSDTPFANCPLDPAFRHRLAEDMALFARIARPAFIFTEDDFSIRAAAGSDGCFCKWHLEEFARRTGVKYTREELVALFESKTPESIALKRKWRELMKDSLSGLAGAIRTALDRETPEIPMGYMQSGGADGEGDCTEAVARAMAGEGHTPFSRICGTFYGPVNTKAIPSVLFHPLHSRQHIRGNFHFLHETDTYPRNCFFASGAYARAMMGAVYSMGFEGSIFHVLQRLDKADEEPAFSRMFAAERSRLTEAAHVASQCRVKGAELPFDPFWHTEEKKGSPAWVGCVSRFGIPYTSEDAAVAFWDETIARNAEDEKVMARLSRGLFLDAPAARALCQRGYGEYLGAEIGEDIASGKQAYDISELEVICAPFVRPGKGCTMSNARLLAGPRGKMLAVRPADPACEVIAEGQSFRLKNLGSTMTRFENKLGGRIVITGIAVEDNQSAALFNYRRQRLIQDMLLWCADEFVFVRESPDMFVIVNEAVDPQGSGLHGMITLINLCEDERETLTLHLPPAWEKVQGFEALDIQGNWQPLSFEKREGELILHHEFSYLKPVYILAR